MNSIFILKEIARWDRKVWKLFSLLNREMNKYFCIGNWEYEMCFRIIDKDEFKIYYKLDGKYHRTDGPAMIDNGGTEEWLVNGKYHRLDGPAVIRKYYCNWWYKNEILHRLDGPAVEYVKEDMKKYNEWWVDGKEIEIENDE